jgi:DNA (cytosine-5)-methyltransferase 1
LDTLSAAQSPPKLASVLEKDPPSEFFMDETTLERIRNSVFVNRLVDGVRILYNQGGGARMGYTVFGTDGVAPALTASHSRHYERYQIGDRYRRLTNKEYARLQGFPDDHCAVASAFNQYGLYGNAVPPPLAESVISKVVFAEGLPLDAIVPLENTQMSLFS